MLKNIMTIVVAFALPFIANAQNLDHLTAKKEIEAFGNFSKVSQMGNIVYAGQPDADTIKILKEQGYDMVVSVKFDDEKVGYDERKVVEENGMSFVRIPFYEGSINDKVRTVSDNGVAELSKMLSQATLNGSKVFLHCGSGQRAAGALGSILARDYGYSKEAATKAAKDAGLTSEGVGKAMSTYLDGLK
ncbi:hypothetical protein [Pseudemcibacter aquimaris]|uniref:hypothetical protein n=1 Tax=Pseudemcibacter aquimaris TaxID=2857064 RepID=UPI0020133D81|nr:hypothetical protein [Pseudemcibacter aquimaris]MCC3861113.1 hypothetical protein [Pseudemcibacter aquimaris]WDU59931.1 hypothetical protein KW060_06635 [Pseudemcibacter aquimaris]